MNSFSNATATLILGLMATLTLTGCPQNSTSTNESTSSSASPSDMASSPAAAPSSEAASPAAATETDTGKGIGPVKTLELGALDQTLVKTGQKAFEAKCTSCHKLDAKLIGPALKGVTQRRKPEWVMNMILNPTEMTQKDPAAKALLSTYQVQMIDLKVAEPDARAIYEYFRSVDGSK